MRKAALEAGGWVGGFVQGSRQTKSCAFLHNRNRLKQSHLRFPESHDIFIVISSITPSSILSNKSNVS
jgi:hypothetical protein